jgi:glycosyltransferase involved in cell wall biosynthesis
MRVLFYSSIFPRPWNTTLGIYCFHACRAMARLGHDVRVVSPRSWLERPGAAKPLAGLSELNVEYPLYVYPPRVLHSASDRFMELSSRRVVRRLFAEWRPDCILSYWVHPDGAVAARLARRLQIPSAVIVGGSDVLVLPRQGGARRRSILRALHSIDAVITVGQHLADATVALGIPARKVHVVYQGVDTEVFSPGSMTAARRRLGLAEHGKVLVAVGSLLPVKGIDVLLQALSSLRKKRSDVQLCLVGKGASRADLEAQAAKLGLRDAVRFVGSVEQSQLPDWYRAADVTVLASRSEGVPNVLRESLACGTPFVATSVGGVYEIAAGTMNRVVAPEDPVALERAIEATLEEPRPDVPADRLMTWDESTRQMLDVLRASSEAMGRRAVR